MLKSEVLLVAVDLLHAESSLPLLGGAVDRFADS